MVPFVLPDLQGDSCLIVATTRKAMPVVGTLTVVPRSLPRCSCGVSVENCQFCQYRLQCPDPNVLDEGR